MPTTPPGSYEKFSYLLRPSKQVERKLVVEALQRLRYGGFALHDYTYVGLGSVYYADFVLFHKYLYIDRMICAEASNIPKRMRFNKPYGFVSLRMEPIGDLIPRLSRRRPHFLWLDYDYGLNEDVIQDVLAAANALAADSILLVTVDVEPRHQINQDASEDERTDILLREFPQSFGRFIDRDIKRRDFSANSFPRLVSQILRNLLAEACARRPGLIFFPLFNFQYADGAQMLSIGGIIGTEETGDRIRSSGIMELPFVTRAVPPVWISVPPLTPREKHWLDQNMRAGLRARDLRFELAGQALVNFRRYQRHYPSYFETLV